MAAVLWRASLHRARFCRSVGLALLAITLSACKSRIPEQRFPFHGVVMQIEWRSHQVLVQHDDIPGLMKGMTMPFTVRDTKTLRTLKVGDVISATLVKQEYTSWLEDVKVVGH